tara:strand:- start:232 stop:363 length:132 start_codon:yes stop_codon:yes gene_type:complete
LENHLLLEEAITALREEIVKDLADSLPVNPGFSETSPESSDIV